MNHHGPGNLSGKVQQVTMLSEIPCPACAEHTLVSLTNMVATPQRILGPGRVRENIKVTDFHVLCFNCLYRAHWVPTADMKSFGTVWESQETVAPHGGLVERPGTT